MKKRDYSLDIIRIIATAMIVVFHTSPLLECSSSWLTGYKSGSWGALGTSVFFILSGYLLRMIYKTTDHIGKFYKKRFLSIFPPFYIAFLVTYLINVVRARNFFYNGSPLRLLWTLAGFDCYMTWFDVPTYALVGEWFTGVIVVLYLLYPLFTLFMNRIKWVFTGILVVFYVLNIALKLYPVVPDISLISCTLIFWAGMLLAEYREKIRSKTLPGVVCLVLAIVFMFVKLPEYGLIYTVHIEAVLLFAGLLIVFTGLSKTEGRGKGFKILAYLSDVSYSVYLVHHYLYYNIGHITEEFEVFSVMPRGLYYLFYLCVTMVTASGLFFVNRCVLKLFHGKNKP